MPSYESTAFIAASRERIWAVLADVNHWHQWTPTITSVQSIDSRPLELGARFEILQPRLPPAVWTVKYISPPNGFAWETGSPGLHVVAEHRIEEIGDSQQRVIQRVTFTGVVGQVLGRLFGVLTERYLAQECTSLKRRIETQQ